MIEVIRSLWIEACRDCGFFSAPTYMPPSFARRSSSPACRRYLQLLDECKVRLP